MKTLLSMRSERELASVLSVEPRAGAMTSAEIFNDAGKGDRHIWFEVRNAAGNEPAELLIYDAIGKDPWGDGIGEKDFTNELGKIPRGTAINLRINSVGGSVAAGLAIYNRLTERKNDVTAIIDGVALSTASWIALAGKKTVIPENGLMMMHNPAGMTWGDAKSMRDTANILDKHKDSIVSMYRTKTGKTDKEISDAMDAETWFTGKEAKEWGLADEVTSPANIQNNFDISRFRNVPEAIAKLVKPPETENKTPLNKGSGADENTMKREQIIALLKEQGIAVENSATDEQLLEALKKALAKPPPENKEAPPPGKSDDSAAAIVALQKALESVTNKLEDARKATITAEIDRLVENNQLPANFREKAIARAIKDESILEEYRAMPEVLPGAEPVNVEIKAESDQDIVKAWNRFQQPIDQWLRGAVVDLKANAKAIGNSAIAFGHFFNKHRQRLLQAVNANTIPAGLQRQVILQDAIRAFAKVLVPLRGFATVFNANPLQGTNKINVPYYPLVTVASTDFVTANGYVMGDSTFDQKEVTINKRKYQPIRLTSEELARQPAIDIQRIVGMKAEKLAFDVFTDILSVVTLANYGAAALVEGAGTFDADDIATLRGVANAANWPMQSRSLVVDTAYDTNLFKQDGFQRANELGSTAVIQGGDLSRIDVMGFDYHTSPNIPTNAQNLVGFIAHMSAILVGVAPIQPNEEVRKQLSSYQVVTEPITGISFEYRLWGNPDMDERREVVEANYGFAVGEAAALKRITSA